MACPTTLAGGVLDREEALMRESLEGPRLEIHPRE
jgi:hypothetical protein